jgi:hypothetical protein
VRRRVGTNEFERFDDCGTQRRRQRIQGFGRFNVTTVIPPSVSRGTNASLITESSR